MISWCGIHSNAPNPKIFYNDSHDEHPAATLPRLSRPEQQQSLKSPKQQQSLKSPKHSVNHDMICLGKSGQETSPKRPLTHFLSVQGEDMLQTACPDCTSGDGPPKVKLVRGGTSNRKNKHRKLVGEISDKHTRDTTVRSHAAKANTGLLFVLRPAGCVCTRKKHADERSNSQRRANSKIPQIYILKYQSNSTWRDFFHVQC